MTEQIAHPDRGAAPYPGATREYGGRVRWLALFVVLLATFMDLMDVTIVGVALPKIQNDLGAAYSTGQWMVAGYALSYALTLVTGGRLGDIAGRRKVFMTGVAGFTIASAVAGAALTPSMLITARVAQGAFGGVMVPQVMSVIATQFAPGRERTTAFSLYGVLLGIAQVSGPVLGGVLTGYSAWRMIFYINVPIGIFALIGAARWMKESASDHPLRLDIPGVLLIGAASLLLCFPLVQGREQGWPPWSVAAMAAATPMLIIFVWYERRRERRNTTPLVPTHLFAKRSFSAGLILMIVLFSGVSCYFMLLTWALQFGLGWTPLHLAITSLAWPAGIACTAQLTNRHGHRHGRRLVGTGTTLMAIGTALLAGVVARYGNGLTSGEIVPCMFLSGLGMGLTIPILSNLVLGDVPADDAGAASGVLNSVVQIGGAMGVALAGVIFFGGARAQAELGAAPRTLAYCVAVFVLAGLLSPLLPRQAAALPGGPAVQP
jgi:EmrB/QacA subfamily drug resistance transporter